MAELQDAAAVDQLALAGIVLDGKYRIDRFVAEGGFGIVYAGHHLTLDVPVAIKVLKTPTDLSEASRAEFVDKFVLEAKTIARMRHPNIVQVLDTGVATLPSGARAPYAVLEWLTGDTLEELLSARRGVPFSKAQAFALMKPVLDALSYAHDERIAHRDVKPANIMLVPTKRGVAMRLLDFGIAKIMTEGESAGSGVTRTRSGRITYSPAYAAPEQLASSRTGAWTDVHAVALILTELLTGAEAYGARDATELFSIALAPERPTPRKLGIDVGAWEPVLAKALAIRPEDRYGDATELTRALVAGLGETNDPVDVALLVGSLPHFRVAIAHADTVPSQPDLPRYVGPADGSGPHPASGGFPTQTAPAQPMSSTDAAATRDMRAMRAKSPARRLLPVALAGAGVLTLVGAVLLAVALRSHHGTAATSSRTAAPPPVTAQPSVPATAIMQAPAIAVTELPVVSAPPAASSVRRPPPTGPAMRPTASAKRGTSYTLE